MKKLIIEDGKFYLKENYVKTIKKTDVSSSQWHHSKDEVDIFKYPFKRSEMAKITDNSTNVVRLAIADGGDLYYWNGEILHGTVADFLGEFWLLNLVWQKGKIFANISTSSNASEKQIKKYIETDDEFIEGLKKVKSAFPISRLKLGSEIIKI